MSNKKEKCSLCEKDSTIALIVIFGGKNKNPVKPSLCKDCFLLFKNYFSKTKK